MATYTTDQALQAIQFDCASIDGFDTIASLGSGAVITTTQAILPIPYDCKIYRVALSYTASASTATTIQIAVGTGALGTVGTTDTFAPAGTVLFSTPPTVANNISGISQTWTPDNWDVIYQASSPLATAVYPASSLAVAAPALTLRMTSATGAITNLKVMLGLKPYNSHFAADYATTPAGSYAFDPSVF